MTLHLVIEYKWLHELGAHKIFFCPLCHCCYIPRAWIRIRVYVWRWVSACKYIYTYMYVLVLTYISVHMGIIFLLHIMYYLWMIYICLMQLLFNFGNKLIFIVIVIVIVIVINCVSLKTNKHTYAPTRQGKISHRANTPEDTAADQPVWSTAAVES